MRWTWKIWSSYKGKRLVDVNHEATQTHKRIRTRLCPIMEIYQNYIWIPAINFVLSPLTQLLKNLKLSWDKEKRYTKKYQRDFIFSVVYHIMSFQWLQYRLKLKGNLSVVKSRLKLTQISWIRISQLSCSCFTYKWALSSVQYKNGKNKIQSCWTL